MLTIKGNLSFSMGLNFLAIVLAILNPAWLLRWKGGWYPAGKNTYS